MCFQISRLFRTNVRRTDITLAGTPTRLLQVLTEFLDHLHQSFTFLYHLSLCFIICLYGRLLAGPSLTSFCSRHFGTRRRILLPPSSLWTLEIVGLFLLHFVTAAFPGLLQSSLYTFRLGIGTLLSP